MKKEFLQYNAEDFALEDDFIRWVKEEDSGLDALWQDWLKRHPDKAGEINLARRIVNSLEFSAAKASIDVDRLWERIDASTSAKVLPLNRDMPVKSQGSLRNWYYLGTAVAACLALFYLLRGWDKGSEIENFTLNRGETFTAVLPDKSTIRLNSESSLQYDQKKWDVQRKVKLAGEAFLEVQKGSSFVVSTDLGEVRVLGTSFNVYARGDSFNVACITGSVSVKFVGAADSILLSPGESCANTPDKRLYAYRHLGIEWLQGIFRYDSRPLYEVFDEIERQFNVEVEYPATIENVRYTGFFTKDDLEKALYSVCWPMKFTYKIEGTRVRISEDAQR